MEEIWLQLCVIQSSGDLLYPKVKEVRWNTTPQLFSKMKELVTEYYMHHENIPTEMTDWEEDEEDSFFCL